MNYKFFKLFNIIAPIYAKFYNFQVKYYDDILEKTKEEIDLTQYKTVLDIGCGTGALCYVLYKNGLKVTGIDLAEEMVRQAEKRLKDTNIEIYQVDANKKFPFPNQSFDIVVSSYVIHGLKSDQRIKLYKEAARLAKEKVIFHDYNQKRTLITTIVECFEGGDYFNFLRMAESEMKEHFKSVKIVDVHKKAAWYILEP